MAVIEKGEMRRFVDIGLATPQAFRDLATISREMRLKRGETGFSAQQMKNFTFGHTCSPQVREAILDYFRAKAGELARKLERL